MRKHSGSIRHSGAYTSPGTPEYAGTIDEVPKGWCSERVPLPTNSGGRRHISAAALIPFNSGRALPSKWDDAERWITSPLSGLSGHNSFNTFAAQSQRHPESKSGPLGSPGLVYTSNYSPTMNGGSVKNFMGNSPLTTGVLVPEGISIQYDARIASKFDYLYHGNNINRSTCVTGMSDVLSETMFPASQGDILERAEEEEGLVSKNVSRRDMATQMSPEGSSHSSTKGRLSFAIFPSSGSAPNDNVAAKDEVRDVQVDKGTSTGRDTKKQGLRKMKDSRNIEDLPTLRKMKDSKNIEDLPSPWGSAEARKNVRLQREEAQISAWENLQQAKSEAAVQKLEMKLQKMRSALMDKILKELETSQARAQTMRNSLLENQTPRASLFVKMRSFIHRFLCYRNY